MSSLGTLQDDDSEEMRWQTPSWTEQERTAVQVSSGVPVSSPLPHIPGGVLDGDGPTSVHLFVYLLPACVVSAQFLVAMSPEMGPGGHQGHAKVPGQPWKTLLHWSTVAAHCMEKHLK